MIDQQLKERFIETLKRVGTWPLRSCCMCGTVLEYVVKGDNLYFNSNCICVTFVVPLDPRSWDSLDYFLAPEHGHIENIKKYVEVEEAC